MSIAVDLLAPHFALFDTPAARAVEPGLLAGALLYAALPWLRPTAPWARILLTALSGALMIYYVAWRYLHSLPDRHDTLNWIAGILFFIIEAFALLAAALTLMFVSRRSNRSPEADAHRSWFAARAKPPLVDVFICTYNEDRTLLERTIIGAMGMDYPRFRTWILDDGKRPAIRSLCKRLGCGYLTRPDNRHAKAGNINAAFDHVAALAEAPDFVMILDADFVPLANFLTRTLSLFHEDSVGIVQTPQHFINPDPIQTNLSLSNVWPDEQRYFFDILMPAMDAWGCAFCCGTSSVIRFEAIRSIGGLPTDSVTEDYLTTLRLKEKGYRTVYLNEPLSFGLAPEGLKEYVTQRGRWCLGLMQIVQGRSGPLSLTARIGLAYRIGLVHSFLSWSFVYLYKLAGIVVPSIYLMFGVKAIDATLLDLIAVFFPYFVIHSMTMGWISQGRILFVLTDLAQFLTAPAALKSVFSGIVKPRGRRFKVTAKGGDRRARFVEWPLFRIFFSLLVFAVAAVMVAFYWPGADPRPDAAALPLVWSWFNIFALSLLCLVCIEQPRRRASDRFPGQGDATVVVGGARHRFRINDISAGGAQLEGAAPAPVGRVVLVTIGDDYLQAMIIRKNDKRFAVRFANTLETRVRAVRHVYSGLYRKAMGVIEPVPIVGAIARRIFR